MKSDKIALIIGLILICAFVVFLPHISDLTRNSAANNEVEPEKVPVTYTCERDYNESNIPIVQNAIYKLSDKEVKSTDIERTFTFTDATSYNNYKSSIKVISVTGITDEYTYDDTKLVITEKITISIDNVSSSDLSQYFSNFPKTYDNLLKYTQNQKCNATY